MSRDLSAKLGRLLRRPLFGTFVVPKDARVDPAQFPEEEYPVFCPKCRYLLRGLPDGVCPECGKPFETGALLVRQYVFGWGLHAWRQTRSHRAARVFLVAALVCVGVVFIGFLAICFARAMTAASPTAAAVEAYLDWGSRLARTIFVFYVFGSLLLGVWCVLSTMHVWRTRAKRRAIIAAVRAAWECRAGNDAS